METLGSVPGVPGLFIACIFSAALGVFGGAVVIAFAFLSAILGTTVLQIMLSVFGMAGGPLLGLFLMGMFLPCGVISGFAVSTVVISWIVTGAYVYRAPLPELSYDTSGCKGDSLTSIWNHYKENEIDAIGAHPILAWDNDRAQADDTDSNCLSHHDYTENFFLRLFLKLFLAVHNASKKSLKTLSERTGFKKIYTLSFLWYPTLTISVSLVVWILVSLCTGWTKKDINPQYVYPVREGLLCCLPMFVQRWCNCNAPWTFRVQYVDTILSEDDDDGSAFDHSEIKETNKDIPETAKLLHKHTKIETRFEGKMNETTI